MNYFLLNGEDLMNLKTGLAGVLLGVIFTTSVSAHHAAFGIISGAIPTEAGTPKRNQG